LVFCKENKIEQIKVTPEETVFLREKNDENGLYVKSKWVN
jgi:hypothetical protein